MKEKSNVIELKRISGMCCPEPSCDYAGFDFVKCKMCGKSCEGCRFWCDLLKDILNSG